MRRHRVFRSVVVATLGALLLLACTSGEAEEPAIEPITAPGAVDTSEGEDEVAADAGAGEEASTDPDQDPGDVQDGAGIEVEVDVTVIPDEITPEYVEAVLAELEQLYADALRELMIAGEPTIEVTDRLGSVFIEEEYQPRLSQFLELSESQFSGIAAPRSLRPREHSDGEVLDVSNECIYAETVLDVSGVFDEEVPVEASFVQLGLPDRGVVNDLNPTPWMVHAFPVGDDHEMRERRPCEP